MLRMAYIKNPQYNPNDPKSMRYINVPDAPMSPVAPKAPNMSVLPPATPAPNQSVAPMSVAPKVTAPVPNAPTPNMSVAPPAPTTMPNYDVLKPNTDTAVKSTTLFGTTKAQPTNPYAAITGNPGTTENPGNPGTPSGSAPPPSTGGAPTLDDAQRNSISNLINSNRPFNETDARNYAYATGASDYRQFIGKTGSQITGVGSQGGTANPTGEGLDTNPNPNNPNGMSDRDLAIAAGRAGISVDDYIAAVQGKSPQTQEEYDAIRNRLGIPGLIDETYKKPQKSTVDIYNEFYNLSGLDTVKQKISAIDEEIAQKRRDLVTATGELQNNPWLSQATRTGRLRILTQLAEADINNSLLNRQQYLDQYNDGVAKVEDYVKRNVYDQGQERELNVDKLNYLLSEAERQDKAAQAKTKAQALRYLPDYLTSKADNSTQFNTGSIQEYRFYEQQERAAGRTPMSYDDYQTMDANRKAQITKLNSQGLDSATAGRVDRIVGGFDNEPIVKGYNTIQEGYNFMNSVPNDTKNPADQQGLIYAFAKIMDPNSVVREGEYATVQKYAQSWATTYGFNAARIFSNSPFLTPAAIQNMKNTIEKKYQASSAQYNNLVDEYGRRVNKITGQNDGKDYLTNYAGSATAPPDLKTYYQKNPQKQAQINTLINQGLSDEDILQVMGASTFKSPPSTGVNGSAALQTVTKKYPEGTKGGQCGVFAHKIVEFPPIGDAKSEKFASVDKFGIPAAKWRQSPQIGDVIVTDESKQYGHVAVVNAIMPDGSLRLTESNFRGKESVSHDRTLPINSPKIYGAFRGKLKA